jgi:outer membrane biogenesis lipoprotein LolB
VKVLVAWVSLLLLAACEGGDAPAAGQNEAKRINEQIEGQAAKIVQQAENGTVAIEQALENEQAGTFDNRAALLNETGANTAQPARR